MRTGGTSRRFRGDGNRFLMTVYHIPPYGLLHPMERFLWMDSRLLRGVLHDVELSARWRWQFVPEEPHLRDDLTVGRAWSALHVWEILERSPSSRARRAWSALEEQRRSALHHVERSALRRTGAPAHAHSGCRGTSVPSPGGVGRCRDRDCFGACIVAGHRAPFS